VYVFPVLFMFVCISQAVGINSASEMTKIISGGHISLNSIHLLQWWPKPLLGLKLEWNNDVEYFTSGFC